MKAMLQRFPLILALVAMLTLFASCGKEALVEPCGYGEVANAKAASLTDEGNPADASSGGVVDPDGTGISDDGDDLSGSERNRKKRTS